ncbi:MAG: PD40 domain-containing protein [Candidatus Aminicenantes bacterium]|nr:PD40 domain-containing protein [Candidatus Aminicenantes bacterium]
MFKRILFAFFVLLFFGLMQVTAAAFARYPAPSPDGSTLVFSYQGDLWSVPVNGGRGLRLTVHEAYDSYPVWSPDGKEIAFSSDRYGNDDIYVIPAEGGAAQRLTYFSTDDRMCDWLPGGGGLVFAANRDFYYHRVPVLYRVPRSGGTPKKMGAFFANEGKISPDGKWLVFSLGRYDWARKRYRGSSSLDLWLYSIESADFKRLTEHDGNDYLPMWSADSQTIYYVTDKDGTFNIWSMDISGSGKKQLTRHNSDGVRFSAISKNGKIIVYEWGTGIYTIAASGGEPRKVEISAPTEEKVNQVEWKTFSSEASEMALSPDEKQLAFVVRGEVFVMKNEKNPGKAVRLTDTPARESDITWSPDSEALVYVSDREGNKDLFIVKSIDPAEKRLARSLKLTTLRFTLSEKDEYAPQFSPDGSKLAYIEGLGDLKIIDMKTQKTSRLLKGWAEPEYSWSPDSKWIAYSLDDNEFNRDIRIIPAAGGDSVNITQHPDADGNPVWSEDGRKLAFTSRRIGDSEDIWMVFLRREDEEKTKEDFKEEEGREKEQADRKDRDKKDKKGKKKAAVRIDFEDIHRRLRRVTSLEGSESRVSISPDGKTFMFTANIEGRNDLWSVKWDGAELKRITKGGQSPNHIQWTKDGKKLFYLSLGKIKSITKEGKVSKLIPFQAKMTINHRAERLQKFDEGWRTLNRYFYDPGFHGIDWQAMKKKYRPVAAEQATIRGFNDVVTLMLGELNASHLGIRGPVTGPRISTGMLGLRFDESYKGQGLKVESVLPEGPGDIAAARVYSGETLIRIGDKEIDAGTNIHALLNETVGERVPITLLSKDKKERSLVVRPIDKQRFDDLEYKRWVKARRQKVDQWSGGKLGYVHIRGMSMPGFEQFEMELYSVAHGKEGLIIDVRNNGGGWTTDYMLAVLSPRPHAYTIPRDGEKGYPLSERLPFYAWSKPVTVMCNEWSFSNAEIFPHAVKTLKRGKVVGSPTGGLVISTGGISLIDGASFRVPFRGWYTLSTGLNQENNGCIPDVVVWDQPGDRGADRDPQLKKAVDVLLKDVAK